MRGIRRDVVKIVSALRPDRTLDVCCGTGDQLRLLAARGIDAVGIDLSLSMLGRTRKAGGEPRYSRQDATCMGIRTGSVDLATVSFALHETGWENAEKIIGEVHRILAPAGRLLVVDYDMDVRTDRLAAALIGMIEFLAGRRHFRNFRTYRRRGGLDALINKADFSLSRRWRRAGKSVGIRLYVKTR